MQESELVSDIQFVVANGKDVRLLVLTNYRVLLYSIADILFSLKQADLNPNFKSQIEPSFLITTDLLKHYEFNRLDLFHWVTGNYGKL